ncbi:MAG: glycoside hydrolase family 16 protein [Pontiellaceae bacterium]|nr:glycoside hydrolase family 16 protein [Pontiellaceae bacterium]MBN2785996.1 glycoside hydrolase family 16 protein [Pontiellaceae bacterium]
MNSKIIQCLTMAILSLSCTARAQIWSEEFNTGSLPDRDIWSYDTGAGGWGNAELQEYTTNSANARIEDGQLVITAIRQGNSFTSGRVKTQDKLTFKYGTVEARIQIPDLGNGLWPAFWTLGNNISSVSWPACGEIDVMEMGNAGAIADGVVNRRTGSTAHWESGGGHASYGLNKDVASNLNGSFHIYRMEWTPDAIKTYIDGIWIWTIDISGGAASDLEEFHQPHFFVLNMAVGGTYTGIYNASGITAAFPAEYRIDYIRLYDNGYTELGGTSTVTPPDPGSNLLTNEGFEFGTTGWSTSLSGGSADTSSSRAKEGSQSLIINSDGAGDWASPNASQSFQASEGDVFNLQGYLLNPSSDPISGSSFGLFKIEFRDGSGNVLDPATVDIGGSAAAPYYGAESTPFLNASSPTDSWIFSEVQAEAPAGTATVGFYLLNVNQPGNTGPVYFDAIQATLIGDPAEPVNLSASVTGDQIQLSFPSQNGVNYQLAYKSCLTNAAWIPLETVVGDGSTNTLSQTITSLNRFYTILIP